MHGFFSFSGKHARNTNDMSKAAITELHNALQENQFLEKKQMEMINQDQKQQNKKEKALADSVRFPQDEDFQMKMKNAELYVRLLMEREAAKKEAEQSLMQSVQETINWQRQKWKNPAKNAQEAAARLYLRFYASARNR